MDETEATETEEDSDDSNDAELDEIEEDKKAEADKTGTDKEFKGFELPLAKPSFQSATSQGSGKVSLVWDEVTEASSYEVSYSENGTDFTQPVSVTGTEYVVSGLTVGKEYTFKLTAVRVLPAAVSEAATITMPKSTM